MSELSTTADAASLDGELRTEARTVAHSMVRFRELIATAKAENIHETLGFGSWTVYVADVIGSEMGALQIDDRRQIVALLTSEGMSGRAQAEALGVSNATISRDQAAIPEERLLHDVTVVEATESATTGLALRVRVS